MKYLFLTVPAPSHCHSIVVSTELVELTGNLVFFGVLEFAFQVCFTLGIHSGADLIISGKTTKCFLIEFHTCSPSYSTLPLVREMDIDGICRNEGDLLF